MPVLRAPSAAAARRFLEHVAELGALTRMHVGFDRVSGSGSQSVSSISGIL